LVKGQNGWVAAGVVGRFFRCFPWGRHRTFAGGRGGFPRGRPEFRWIRAQDVKEAAPIYPARGERGEELCSVRGVWEGLGGGKVAAGLRILRGVGTLAADRKKGKQRKKKRK